MRVASPSHIEATKRLHAEDPFYGAGGDAHAKDVIKLCRDNGLKSVLDFGCGKGKLKAALNKKAPDLTVFEFDPAIDGKETLPKNGKADLVVALDVLQDVEPAFLESTLNALRYLRPKAVFISLSTGQGLVTLPGAAGGLSMHSAAWWEAELQKRFYKIYANEVLDNYVFVGALK